jgi:hypothetical protein
MEVTLIMLAAAILLLAYVGMSSRWKPIQTARGPVVEEVEAKYAFLKENRIKCRLKTESTMHSGVIAAAGTSQDQVMRLLVKEKDLQRALELLEEFEQSEGIPL